MDTKTLIERAATARQTDGIRRIADALGLTTQAVYAWGDTVPALRVYQLKELRPEWFEARADATVEPPQPAAQGAAEAVQS